MYELKVVTRFAAAHQLTMVGTKCENMHGHNWRIEVYVIGENLDKAGVLVDFGVIKKHVADIMTMLDHKYLNELAFFEHKQVHSGYNNLNKTILRLFAAFGYRLDFFIQIRKMVCYGLLHTRH